MGQVIHDSGKRLERLIENFLIYAQIELLGADPQKVARPAPEADAVARQADRGTRPRPGRRRQPAGRFGRWTWPTVPVPISEDYLAKIVDELVQNAFKFSEPGTRVRVALFALAQRRRALGHGPGPRASRPNTSPKSAPTCSSTARCRSSRDWASGLTIAKRLTELHGGTLTIQSERGAATTVTVKLPKVGSELKAVERCRLSVKA